MLISDISPLFFMRKFLSVLQVNHCKLAGCNQIKIWHAVELFDTQVGLKYLRGMHLNDSKTECGSKKDRHDNIGVFVHDFFYSLS